jgi:hypothetical protein
MRILTRRRWTYRRLNAIAAMERIDSREFRLDQCKFIHSLLSPRCVFPNRSCGRLAMLHDIHKSHRKKFGSHSILTLFYTVAYSLQVNEFISQSNMALNT